jgi:hypothetical protein
VNSNLLQLLKQLIVDHWSYNTCHWKHTFILRFPF